MKSETINARIKPETREKLERLAKMRGESMSKVVENMINDAAIVAGVEMAEGLADMNSHPQIRPFLEWFAANDQFYKAAVSRYELSEQFDQSYTEFMFSLSGFMNGLYKAALEEKREAKNN